MKLAFWHWRRRRQCSGDIGGQSDGSFFCDNSGSNGGNLCYGGSCGHPDCQGCHLVRAGEVMPILGDKLYNELDQERIICITGSLSGGKTRLAFDIALYYWRKGFRVFSNVPHNYENWTGVEDYDLFKSYLVIDEGGEYIRNAKVASLITRSAGKANYYAVFAGKRLPHKNLQDIVIRPRFDFYQNYGIPLILWRAKVNSDEPYKFVFWQWLPQKVHGTYSTLTSSAGLEDMFARAQITVTKLAAMEGQVAGEVQEAGITGFAEDIAEGIAAIS